MHSSKADDPGRPGWGLDELQLLAALGFGPESALMNEPKLFFDAAFLGALLRELEAELGAPETARTLFHIGVIHGLRDARRIGGALSACEGGTGTVECPPLAMRIGARRDPERPSGRFEVSGSWPDQLEADARLSRLGDAAHPACALSAGYTSGWLSGTLDRDVVAVERTCRAAGAPCCTFVARDEEVWLASPAASAPKGLPIARLRAVALPSATASMGELLEALPDRLDPADPAVHIWGPVMVMPFAGPEAALQTIELLGREAPTHQVRVVVLDLCGLLVDEGFGAAALEDVVAAVQDWGAEVILTGISPLSEAAVADLQASLLLSRKDLPEAIAYAFQIAEAQRHLL